MVVTSGIGLQLPKGIPIGTVRESTRGLEDNKQFIVIEPIADFDHIEYVIVYRYRPNYAQQAARARGAGQLYPAAIHQAGAHLYRSARAGGNAGSQRAPGARRSETPALSPSATLGPGKRRGGAGHRRAG